MTKHSPRRSRRRQSGLTLIEMAVTIALLAIGVVGVGSGIAATQRIAAINQDQSQLEVAMRYVADYVRDSSSQGLPYTVCATTYTLAAGVVPSGLGASVSVKESQPNSAVRNPGNIVIPPLKPIPPDTIGGNCTGAAWQTTCTGTRCDYGVQEIKVQLCDVSCSNPSNRSLTRIVWKSVSW